MVAATTITSATPPGLSLAMLLRALKMPTIARLAEEIRAEGRARGMDLPGQYLHHLAELEVHER